MSLNYLGSNWNTQWIKLNTDKTTAKCWSSDFARENYTDLLSFLPSFTQTWWIAHRAQYWTAGGDSVCRSETNGLKHLYATMGCSGSPQSLIVLIWKLSMTMFDQVCLYVRKHMWSIRWVFAQNAVASVQYPERHAMLLSKELASSCSAVCTIPSCMQVKAPSLHGENPWHRWLSPALQFQSYCAMLYTGHKLTVAQGWD